jgi:hypothetical protein
MGGVNAKKYYADLSTATAIGNATWTVGTNTFKWEQSSYAYMVVPGGSFVGDLSEYTTIGLTVSDIENEFRVDILANGKTFTGKGINTNGNIVLNILSDFNVQWSDTKITTEDLKSVSAVRLNTNSASGSAVVTKFYIAKPLSLSFDDTGEAEIPLSDLVTTGGLTFDDQTGELTNDGTGGTLAVNMPADGIDFSNFTSLVVNNSGDLIDHSEIADSKNGISNGFWGSKYNVNFTSGDAMKFNSATNVDKVVWYGNSTAGTMTISSIKIKANVIVCTLPGTPVVLNTLPYYNFSGNTSATATWNVGTKSDTYYGSGSSSASNYVDLTEYEELRIHRDDNTGFRAFFINAAGTGTNNIDNTTTGVSSWNETEKYWVIDLSKVEKYDGKVYLNTIKSEGWNVNNIVNNITVYKTPVNAPNYILTGKGTMTAAAAAALKDGNATYIDATGITAETLFTLANPNTLIVANAGMVSNSSNVIVNDVCANLELTDGKPFKAPSAFTATAAKFTKTVNDAGYATMVIPFEAAVPDGVEAYELTGVSGTAITTNKVTTIAANKPVMIKANAGTYNFTATNANVAATADGLVANGLLNAAYTETTAAADANNYVLQKNGDAVNFYLVNGIAATVKPFRAYLTVSAGARVLSLDLDEATGINEVVKAEKSNAIYNLSGQRMAQPVKGLNIVNGKKVMVK